MGTHGSAPRPSLPKYAGVEVVAALEALEASAVARSDRVEFVDVRRRCGRSLAAFGVEMWPLALVGRQRQGGMAAEVARWTRWLRAILVVWECSTGC